MHKDPPRQKWSEWLDQISSEIIASAVARHVFERWWSVVQANPAIDVNNRFLALIWSSYFERQVLVLRRQLDTDPKAASLMKVMHEVAAYATQRRLRRDDFLSSYTSPEYKDEWQRAEVFFDTFADPADRAFVSAAVVERDMESLRTAAGPLKDVADQWLAHSDRKRTWPALGFSELNACLDLFSSTWRRYEMIAAFRTTNTDIPMLADDGEWESVLDMPFRARPWWASILEKVRAIVRRGAIFLMGRRRRWRATP
jgi:hypothetical protein